jgi:predicted HTH transcriptional regulator
LARRKTDPLEKAERAKRESKYVEFKERFDPSITGEWCELLKDFIAIANSGGGVLVVGVRDDGTASREDVLPVLQLDPAKITDKVFKYTDEHFAGFEVHDLKRGSKRVAAILVQPATAPIAFTSQGSYEDDQGKRKTAFVKGTVYVRHGAKSEPATTIDLRRQWWPSTVRAVLTSA